MKTCSRCQLNLPLENFHMKGRGYRRPECKDCFKAARPKVNPKPFASHGLEYTPNKAAYQRFLKYGITPDEYEAMLERQGRRCAICDSPNHAATNWQVDHDHETGRVRGLLCRPCNIAIGLMKDDTDRLRRAIDYLSVRADV